MRIFGCRVSDEKKIGDDLAIARNRSKKRVTKGRQPRRFWETSEREVARTVYLLLGGEMEVEGRKFERDQERPPGFVAKKIIGSDQFPTDQPP